MKIINIIVNFVVVITISVFSFMSGVMTPRSNDVKSDTVWAHSCIHLWKAPRMFPAWAGGLWGWVSKGSQYGLVKVAWSEAVSLQGWLLRVLLLYIIQKVTHCVSGLSCFLLVAMKNMLGDHFTKVFKALNISSDYSCHQHCIIVLLHYVIILIRYTLSIF